MYQSLNPGHLFHPADLETTAALASKYVFSGISVDIVKASSTPPADVLRILDSYQLRPAQFGLPLDLYQDQKGYEKQLAELETYASFAQKCGIRICNTWLLPGSDQYPYEENFDFHQKRLRPVAELLKKHDIRLGLEFVGTPSARADKKYEFIHTLDQLLELCRAIGTENVGVLLDSFHWTMAGHTFEDFRKFPDSSWITCVHINDAPAGLAPEMQNDLVRALPGSTGVIKIREFFQGLLDLGYTGPVECEPFVAELADMPLEEAVSIVKKSIDQVWPAK